jgi:UrcA family protein
MMMKIGLAAFAALAVVTSAHANNTGNPFSKDQAVLSLKALDLSTPDGQQRLAIRMDEAARTVCGEGVATLHLALEAKAQECRASVIADIRSQIERRTARVATSTRFENSR